MPGSGGKAGAGRAGLARRLARWLRREPGLAAAAGVTLLALAAAAAALAVRGGQQSEALAKLRQESAARGQADAEALADAEARALASRTALYARSIGDARAALDGGDLGRARAWYNSGAYQEIVALRTGNSESDVIMVDGVDSEHKATDVLATSG